MKLISQNDSPLLDCLAVLAPDSSKSTLRSWIKEGRVTIDGSTAKRPDDQVLKGQTVALGQKAHFAEGKVRILYEDRHLVAIEKPEGLLSVSTAFDKSDNAFSLLKRHYHPRKVYVVHRLDQDTSGVMVFALSEEGFEGLKDLFERHDIHRAYYAVVEGNLSVAKGTWQSYLYEDARYHVHATDDPEKGALAITHFHTEKSTPRYSLLKLTLETGKKNQIRVHCLQAGCPVVGDKKYGAITDPANRLCLHAGVLEFVHPVTGKAMKFSSPLPESFNKLITMRPHA